MQKISCFLSSTFNDMQSERDFFRQSLEELVNDHLKEIGCALEFVDLRWGVNVRTENEADYDKKVLSVCLGEIKNTTPYFIVFLGERYGWIPNETDIVSISSEVDSDLFVGKSITEIEILYALSTYTDKAKCLFYFRDPVDFGSDEQAKQQYISTGKDRERLNKLKQKILELFPNQVRSYRASWDAQQQSFVLDDSFRDLVFRDVDGLFREQYENHVEEPEYAKQQRLIELNITKNADLFAGRSKELETALHFVENSSEVLLDVLSEPGFGKTFFLCKVADELIKGGQVTVLPYVCDSSEKNVSLHQLLEYYLRLLGNNTNVSEFSEDALLHEFCQTVNISSKDRPVVILIDGIDNIIKSTKEFPFLNPYAYESETVKFIITRDRSYKLSRHISALNRVELPLNCFSKEDLKEVADHFFTAAHRTVDDDLVEMMEEKGKRFPQTCFNPSYLGLLMHELNNLSQKDFKVINQNCKQNGQNFSYNVSLFQKGMIASAGETFEKEIANLRAKIESEIPLAKYYFDYITLSPHGMSEREMQEVLPAFSQKQDPIQFALFVKSFKSFLMRDQDGFWRFSQKSIAETFQKSMSGQIREQIYREILRLYEGPDWQRRKYRYALFCYLSIGDYEGAYRLLSDTESLDKQDLRALRRSLSEWVNQSSNYLLEMQQLLLLDSSKQLEKTLRYIVRREDISFERWYEIFRAHYNKKALKGILGRQDDRPRVYNNLVELASAAYRMREYAKGYQLIVCLKKYFKDYKGTKLYKPQTAWILELCICLKLGKKCSWLDLFALDTYHVNKAFLVITGADKDEKAKKWVEGHREEIKKEIFELLKLTDEVYQAVNNTKLSEKSPKGDPIDLTMLTAFYQADYLTKEEYLFWSAKQLEYITHKRRACLPSKEEYDQLVAYVRDPNADLDLAIHCCLSLAKFHDYVISSQTGFADEYGFTKQAAALAKKRLADRFSASALRDYEAALTQQVYEDEMKGRLEDEDLYELLKTIKLSISIEPSTEKYNTYSEIYDRCKVRGLLSQQDRADYKKYVEQQKKLSKLEVSADEQHAHKRKAAAHVIRFIFAAILIAELFLAVRYFYRVNPGFLRTQYLLSHLAIVVAMIVAVVTMALGLRSLSNRKYLYAALMVLLSVAATIYVFTFQLSDEVVLEYVRKLNFSDPLDAATYYFNLVKRGGAEYLMIKTKFAVLQASPAFLHVFTIFDIYARYRLFPSISNVKNYKLYRLTHQKRCTQLISSAIVSIVWQISNWIYLDTRIHALLDTRFVGIYSKAKELTRMRTASHFASVVAICAIVFGTYMMLLAYRAFLRRPWKIKNTALYTDG